MKKFLLPLTLSAALASSLFAVDNKAIEDYFDFLPAGISVKIGKTVKVEGTNFDMVELQFMKDGSVIQNDFMFVQDQIMAPDIINLKTKKSYRDELSKQAAASKIGGLYKSESLDNIIKIGNDPEKDTMVIFTDPECPFCRKELANIENDLKKYNVEIVLISVHGDTAFDKINQIYKEAPNAKTDKEKIDLLNKYYAEKAEAPKSSVEEMKKNRELSNKYFAAGIQGVPYKVEKSKLQ